LLALSVIVVLFSLSLNAYSQGWESEKSALGSIVSAVWSWTGGLLIKIMNLVAEQIYAFITFLLEPVVEMLLWLVGWSLRLNPTIYPFDEGNPAVSNLIKTMLKLLIPFYGILLLLIAIYIVYVSISPSDRALAKSQFNKVLMSMFLVSISPPLFQLLLDIELDMVKTIWNIVEDDWSDKVVNGVVVAFLGPQAPVMGWLPVIISVLGLAILAVRYLVVQLLAIFFPLSFFLFFFDYTRTLGANLLRTTILWIFMPVAQALVLAITVIALTGGGVPDHFLAHGLVVLAGMTAFAVSGLMVTGMLKWVGGITAAMGAARGGTFSGAMLQSVGQVGMGFGPDSIVAGAAQVGYLRAGQTTPGMSGIWGRMWGGVKETVKPYGEIGRGVSSGYRKAGGIRKLGILGAVGGFFTGSARAYGSGMARTGGNIARGARESYHGYKTGTRIPKHPDKASGGGAGGTGGGGGEGSDVTATTSVPEAPDFRSGGGMAGNVPDEWRYGKGGSTGMKQLHGRDLSYPTHWWSEHVAPMLVDSRAVMRAVDRGTSQGLRGMSLLHYAMELAKTPGASKMAIAGAFIRGVRGVGFALMPISPFEPIRQIGAFIVGTSAMLLPPGARWVGYQVGNRMMGMGFRQVHGRSRAGRKLWGITGRGGIAKKALNAGKTLAEIEDLEKERLTATGGRLAEIDARLVKLTGVDGTAVPANANSGFEGRSDVPGVDGTAVPANVNKRNDVKAHYRAKRDTHVRAISGTLDALREGTDILNERDPNYVQACLTSLENNYSSKDERQDIFKLVLADSQSLSEGKGYEAHPGTELVRDLQSRVGDKRQEIADASLGARTFDQVSEQEAWSEIFSEEIFDVDDDKFKKEVSRRKRAGTLSSEAAKEWRKKRESLLTHFRAHRIGHRNPETVPMKKRESAQASKSEEDEEEKKLYRAKPLDNAVAFTEMGDYASRAFTDRGLAGYVQLNAQEIAAATQMERILDPQTGAMSLTMDLERTESGAMLLNQEDYSYLRQRMAYEGGQVERVRIEPILRGGAAKKIKEHEAAGRHDEAQRMRENPDNWATDSEGKVMVRNVATLPTSFEHSDTLLNRNTTYGTFQSELLHAAEDPLYQSIGKHGGRNAQISFTDGLRRSHSFDRDDLVQERDASGNLVYGFRVKGEQVGETFSDFRDEANQRRKAGRHSEAVDLDHRADRIREGKGFIALSDLAGHYDENAASGAGEYTYGGQYTPTTAGVVHIESPAHARKFVENNSTYFGGTSDTVHLRGAGVLTENYTMGDTVEVWDPATQSRSLPTIVDDAFLTERGKQLEAMKKLGVYIDSDEAGALVQKGLSGSRVNDFLMRYADHAASLPEAMRPKAIKFDYDKRDANPYAIEKTTGTLVLNAGSKMLQDDISQGDVSPDKSVIPALGHEGGHLLVSWAASGTGSRKQVTTAEDMYEKIIISRERLDETIIEGGNAAVASGRAMIRRSGFNPTDAGMAVDETLASITELGRHSQNQVKIASNTTLTPAEQTAQLEAPRTEELAYIRTQTKALQEATNIYAERAINPNGSVSDNDTANMAQAAAIAKELERRARGLDAALGTTDSAAVRASVEALTGTASAPDKMTMDEAFRAAGHDFSAPSMGGETRRVFELYTGLRKMVSTPVAPGRRVT